MSEPVVKQRPTIDLDEFERRLRQDSAPAHGDDPLAELARLVGEPYDPFGDVFAQETAANQAHHAQYEPRGRVEPGFASPGAPRLFGDFAAIEAGLRGSSEPSIGPSYGLPGPQDYQHGQYPDASGAYGQGGHEQAAYDQVNYPSDWADQNAQHPSAYPQRPSRRPIYVMAATIAVGVIGIGAAFALKSHVSSSPREVRTIMAETGPTKIQPPPETASDAGASQETGLLGKGGRAPATTLVSHAEEPVDLTQAVQDNAARASRMTPGGVPESVTDASAVPVPPSPRQIQTAMADPKAGSSGDQAFGLSDMPAPKRVKVVSVRPDGTILPNDTPPPAAIPASRTAAPVKTSEHAAPVAKTSTPKAVVPKTTSRATTTPKTIEGIAAGDEAAPAETKSADAKPAKKTRPQRVASAETGNQEATEAAAPAPSTGGGGFAVQLAAPGTEAEARAASSRFAKKYADALGSSRVGFVKAESNGKSVYRVRVSSMSKAEAASLCEKLKAEGGTCFVAKN